MEERRKLLREMIEKIDNRRNLFLKIRSEDDVAMAIYNLGAEICELEKLIAIFLMKP